ncbi:TM2 domain-containing protein [Desulfovibrio ferrophilus]|uniref:TM2 domain containing protein n=1 Tax=Desulfovibrio ferrophilus TaxID=241368 RepID=A0A2Z6AU59_9BACT|nr:TM2 domain-containing protein [Desulfovibrio ferrophilus]BBD06767.1 TM2 domain containing protein [Desulfovibrio ferrophilus]
MSDKSISDAVRHLEQMRDEGFLSEEQFGREVRELLKRREADDLPPRSEVDDLPLEDSLLGQMVGHSRPVEYDDQDIVSPDTPTISGLELEIPDTATPAYMPHHMTPLPPKAPPKEAGRVIIRGNAPWDDKGGERVNLDGHKKRNEEENKGPDNVSEVHKPLDPIQRERLARMASRTNRMLNRRKNPEVAFLLSLLWPGLGHAYFGNLGIGVLLMLLSGTGWVGVFFEEYWVLNILVPMGLLSAALVHRNIQAHNRYVDLKEAAEARRVPTESSLNVEKSIRAAGASAATSQR